MTSLPPEWADLLPLAFGVMRDDLEALAIEARLRAAALRVRDGLAEGSDEADAQVFRKLQYMLLCRTYGKTIERKDR